MFIFTSNIFTHARTEKFSLSAMIFWGVDFFHLAKETNKYSKKKNNKIWVWKEKKIKKERKSHFLEWLILKTEFWDPSVTTLCDKPNKETKQSEW